MRLTGGHLYRDEGAKARPGAPLSRRALIERSLCLAAALFAVQAAPSFARAAGEADAGAFLQSIGSRAIELLGDPGIDDDERERRFMDLLGEGFDLPRIARFVIGRYWRRATEAQQDDFVVVFQKVLARRFAPMFTRAAKTEIVVDSIATDKNDSNTLFVQSSLALSSGEVVAATWRISAKDDEYRILDVVIEGASMAITLRSEYGGIIKNDGGRLDNLIAMLRDKTGD